MASYCPYFPIGVAFSGTAEPVNFGGAANDIAFDNITLGAVLAPPPTVPEPASLALMGVGLAGLGMIRRRKAV